MVSTTILARVLNPAHQKTLTLQYIPPFCPRAQSLSEHLSSTFLNSHPRRNPPYQIYYLFMLKVAVQQS